MGKEMSQPMKDKFHIYLFIKYDHCSRTKRETCFPGIFYG